MGALCGSPRDHYDQRYRTLDVASGQNADARMIDKSAKIVLTGAAGLVGQNLIVEMKAQGWSRLVAIDKHEYNLGILRRLHPDVETVLADLAEPGAWENSFDGAACVVQLHAQVTGKYPQEFVRNNLDATAIKEAAKQLG